MTDLLDNPAVQAGIAPFIAAFLAALLLARTRYLAAAVVVGFLVLLELTIGLAFESMTSVRKLILVTLGAGAIALAIEATEVSGRRTVIAALSLASALAAVWVVQRILAQQDPGAAWIAGFGVFAFVLMLVGSTLWAGVDPLRAAAIGACLGWGSGGLAVLGASALLGQIGIALGSACAAAALAQMLRGRAAPAGWTLGLPASVGSGLVGVLACSTGELRWYLLTPLLLVPLAASLVPAGGMRKPWQYVFLAGFAALVPVVVAIGWAWLSARVAASAG